MITLLMSNWVEEDDSDADIIDEGVEHDEDDDWLFEDVEEDGRVVTKGGPVTLDMAARPSAPLYFLAAELPGTPDAHLHMTMVLVKESTAQSDAFRAAIAALGRAITPLILTLGGMAMFGANKDVPVRLVTVDDPAKRAALDAFVAMWHDPPADSPPHVFHVTIAKLGAIGYALTSLVAPNLYLSPVGGKGLKVWDSTGGQ